MKSLLSAKLLVPQLIILPFFLSTLCWSCQPSTANHKPFFYQHNTWREAGGGPDQSKYFIENEIDKSNVNRLQVAWTYSTEDHRGYQFSPIIVDTVMYLLAKNNSLVALNAETGKEIWIHARLQGINWRGVNYWESADGTDRRIIFEMNNYLQEIDAVTGKSILSFGKNGLVSLKEGLGRDPKTIGRAQPTTPGRVFENLILLGSSPGENYFSGPGHLRAYDVITGKLVWTFHTIPQPGEFGYDTWPKDAYQYTGGVNTWGEISLDEKRGIAYFPVGSPTYDYYGADRKGNNLFSDCLLALDARTGKRLWHFQMVHHDLWDFDPTAAPQLLTIQHDGKPLDVVAQATKQGFLFVFNRVTGEPVWPVEERPVLQSDVPGEHSSPTQPFPTVVPPFGRQLLTADDITPYLLSPKERADWINRIKAARTGLFTPLSLTQETIALPGAVGGANLGTTAAIPDEGILFVTGQDLPSVYQLKPTETASSKQAAAGEQEKRGRQLFVQNCQTCHGEGARGTVGPALLDLSSRFDFDRFQQLVFTGKGQMPAFQHLDINALRDIYYFLGKTGGGHAGSLPAYTSDTAMPRGPVVAVGGAPLPPGEKPPGPGRRWFSGPDHYPATVSDTPKQRYTTSYGLEYPFLSAPPWSYIVAYDLNKGIIKWKRPLGQDSAVIREGGNNTGMASGGQRKGMIITSTGVLFSTAKDGRLYAFDADNGNELWHADLPKATEGLPCMYEVHGKHYIVVSATMPLLWGRNKTAADKGRGGDEPGSYVVFALPPKE
ncbi:MAG TPA: PQQ-binding-like beta-propeller repeat protein [Puia sp.]|nr:PQQ-binding-like beta-propeller repeat protein [Puia sp.]